MNELGLLLLIFISLICFYESLQLKIKFIWKLMMSHVRPLGVRRWAVWVYLQEGTKGTWDWNKFSVIFRTWIVIKRKIRDRRDGKKNKPEVRCLATGSFQGILLVSSDVVVCPYHLPPTSTPTPFMRSKKKQWHTHMDGVDCVAFPKLNTVKCFLGICIIPYHSQGTNEALFCSMKGGGISHPQHPHIIHPLPLSHSLFAFYPIE